MEPPDDIDEDELALAMSTELTHPNSNLPSRRTRSFSSVHDAEYPVDLFLPSKHYDIDQGGRTRPIKIQNHSLENQDKDNPDGLWASSVTVTEPSIVKGTQTKGLQAASGYVVWLCTVETFEGQILKTHKRYSEFYSLRQDLCIAFPRHQKLMPSLPPKSVVSKFRPAFLEKRRRGLELFLSTVLLMPELGCSPIVKRVFPATKGWTNWKWWFV